MKIFYAVQATGNGHISRAIEVLPYLQEYGDVDIFLSGNNYGLKADLPIAYRSKGVSLVYNKAKGSVDPLKTMMSIRMKKLWNEIRYLPIEKYDLIINDFECITSAACKWKGLPSVHFGHQASFLSKSVPRPERKDLLGEWVLSNYAKGTRNIGLHFKPYGENIFSPIIKRAILNATPEDDGHITVYLGHYGCQQLFTILKSIPQIQFHLFSADVEKRVVKDNVHLFPLGQELFNESLIRCHGIITGAGFETPSEALYLGKKLIVMPMKGQYEQLCNAAALAEFGVPVFNDIDKDFSKDILKWAEAPPPEKLALDYSTADIIKEIFEPAGSFKENLILDRSFSPSLSSM